MNWLTANIGYIIIGVVTVLAFGLTMYLCKPEDIDEDEHEKGIW